MDFLHNIPSEFWYALATFILGWLGANVRNLDPKLKTAIEFASIILSTMKPFTEDEKSNSREKAVTLLKNKLLNEGIVNEGAETIARQAIEIVVRKNKKKVTK